MSAPDTHDLQQLRAARPELDDTVVAPDGASARALVDAILANDSSRLPAASTPDRFRHRRSRVATAGIASAAAIVVALGVATVTRANDAPHTGSSAKAPATSHPAIQLANIRTIAAHTSTALGTTGRAEITFADGEGANSGTTDLAFSGHDISMVIHFAGQPTSPGFTATNKTVDGRFYLYTPGPDNVVRWYHDSNAGGSSVFNTDPRTLLGALVPEAAFVTVGHGTVDGVAVTHLRATKLDSLPALNLSLGPIDARTFETLDLWVDGHDVVRRLLLTTAHQAQEIDPKFAPKIGRGADGTITLIDPDGRRTVVSKGENLDAILAKFPHVTRTFRSSFSVRFFDIGAPITITAPAGATDLAGKG